MPQLEIKSQTMQDLVTQEAATLGYGYWIGLTDVNSEGNFEWSHSKEPVNYTSWSTGEPDGSTNENCVTVDPSNNYDWATEVCSNSFRPLCFRDFAMETKCDFGYKNIESGNICVSYNEPGFYNYQGSQEHCANQGGTLVSQHLHHIAL